MFPKTATAISENIRGKNFVGLLVEGNGDKVKVLAALNSKASGFDIIVDSTVSLSLQSHIKLPGGAELFVTKKVAAGSWKGSLESEE